MRDVSKKLIKCTGSMDRNAGSGFAIGLGSGRWRLANGLPEGCDRQHKDGKNDNNKEFHCDKAIPFAGSESDQVLDATSTTGLRRKLTSREMGDNTQKRVGWQEITGQLTISEMPQCVSAGGALGPGGEVLPSLAVSNRDADLLEKNEQEAAPKRSAMDFVSREKIIGE